MRISEKTTEKLLIAGLLVAAIFTRFYRLGFRPLWLDEAISYYRAFLPIPNLLKTSYFWDVHPPTYYLILHAFLRLGHSESILRLFSAICGTAAIPAVYFYSKKITDRKAATITTFFLTLSLFHIIHSQQVRVYAFFFLICLFSMIFFQNVLSMGRKRDWMLWACISIFNFYVHYFALILLALQVMYLIYCVIFTLEEYRKPALKFLILSGGIIVLGCLPQLFFFIDQANAKILPDTDFWQAKNPIQFAMILLKNTYYPVTLTNPFWDRAMKYVLGFYLLLGLVPVYKKYRQSLNMILYFLVFTALLTWIASFFMLITGSFRYIIFVNLFFVILYAISTIGWAHLISQSIVQIFTPVNKVERLKAGQNLDRIVLIFLLICFTVLNTSLLKQYYFNRENEDWPTGVTFIADAFKENSVVVPIPGFADYTVKYYLLKLNPNIPFIRMHTFSIEEMETICQTHYQTFFVLTNHLNRQETRAAIETWLHTYGILLWTDDKQPQVQIWKVGNDEDRPSSSIQTGLP